MTITADSVLLVDLDGTLVRGNTFHLWIRYMLMDGFSNLGLVTRYRQKASLVMLAASRLLKIRDHSQFKYGVQRLWLTTHKSEEARARQLDAFLTIVERHLENRVVDKVKELRSFSNFCVLTTAAPADYAALLADRLGFDHVIATPRADQEWCDNIRQTKAARTLEFLTSRGHAERPRILVTDHVDDTPLMRECDVVYLVGWHPSRIGALAATLPARVSLISL